MIPFRPIPADSGVASPCVRNCCLNADDVCMGCGRLITEITGWTDFTAEQKRAVIAAASARIEVLRTQWE